MSDDHAPSSFQTVTNTVLLDGLRERGNRTVWTEFVNRYHPMIVQYGRRCGLNEADAQDAAQQALMAFAEAYQDGKYDREKGRLRKWLFGIARNQILNTRRKLPRREKQVAADSDETDIFHRIEDDNQLEQLWDEQWRDAVLKQCLEEVRREVDAKTVEAFELFAWKGWSAQQVAEHLGMTPNAVFLVKHRVMKRIQALMPQMEEIW